MKPDIMNHDERPKAAVVHEQAAKRIASVRFTWISRTEKEQGWFMVCREGAVNYRRYEEAIP